MLSISSSCCLIGPRPTTGQDSEWLMARARNSDTRVLKRAVQLIDLPPNDCSHAPNAAGGLSYLGSHITCNSLSRMQALLHSILLLLSIAYAVIGTWCSLERKRADCGSCMPPYTGECRKPASSGNTPNSAFRSDTQAGSDTGSTRQCTT